ncbi:DUF4333 domain-containing protein [Streptomyces sp. ISL-1]|uniref:DUF4333 domain-containing protein n=1 Tax=Streptomyces sp. ISL-1 TaxID=2817657 RepID=UPI001BE62A8E|nr:DUF4333 domain-containing protein [Streptomyces sp. ISL-1]MBT2392401.1 DUF4333 domain-containing protein [Streptomyces sp. ISL-1]
MRGFIRIAAATAIGSLALVACSFSAGSSTDSVGTKELEKQVDDALTKQVGQSPKKVECPKELKAEKGAHTRCTLTADDGTRFGLTVTTKRVKSDNKVDFDIKVDDKPM